MNDRIADCRHSVVSERSDERGIALALALFALVVIGALVGSTFFAGRLEQQSGRNTLFAGQAREAAEAGLTEANTSLDATLLAGLPVGATPLDLGAITVGKGATASRDISRLTGSLFLVRAHGTRLGPAGAILAARSLGVLVQLGPVAAPSESLPSGADTQIQVVERGWFQLH
jgi:hypothetical protein